MKLELDIGVSALVFSVIGFILVVILYILVFVGGHNKSTNDDNRRDENHRGNVTSGTVLRLQTAQLATVQELSYIDDDNTTIHNVLDGVLISNGDFILVKNNKPALLNGLYKARIDPSSDGVLLERETRENGEEEQAILVLRGVQNEGKIFIIAK